MVFEAAVELLILSERWGENLAFGRNPVKNCSFETLCIVATGSIDTFLDLKLRQISMSTSLVSVHLSLQARPSHKCLRHLL
jgi:hypothetical protein